MSLRVAGALHLHGRRALAGIALLMASSFAHAASLAPGIYEGLLLAVAPDGSVEGQYVESQGEQPARRCAFLLAGRAQGAQARIESWSSAGSLPGTLRADADGVSLAIPGAREHDGCGLVLLPMIDQGLSLSKVGEANWTHLRRVREPKLWFHPEPAASARRKAYVVRGDLVGVEREVDGWSAAEFVDRATGRRTRGWLASSGLDALEAGRPPAR